MIRTLYIHGAGCRPSDEKAYILKKHGFQQFALHLNYFYEENSYSILRKYAIENEIEFLIGFSRGGFYAHWLADDLGLPCLLFNPALSQRTKAKVSPIINGYKCPVRLIVLGALDSVIDHQRTISYFDNDKHLAPIQKTIICNWLDHYYDICTFEEMVIWAKENLKWYWAER
jgi:hypothetical protein